MNRTSLAGAGRSQSGAGPWETIEFPIAGMTCASCVAQVTRALKRLHGVDRVRVDLRAESAIVRRDPDVATDDVLITAVSGAGYTAALDRRRPAHPHETAGLLGRLIRRRS